VINIQMIINKNKIFFSKKSVKKKGKTKKNGNK
jgi:hypothetical protein